MTQFPHLWYKDNNIYLLLLMWFIRTDTTTTHSHMCTNSQFSESKMQMPNETGDCPEGEDAGPFTGLWLPKNKTNKKPHMPVGSWQNWWNSQSLNQSFILWSYIAIPEVDTLTIFVFLLKGKLINTELSWFLSQFSIKRVTASFGENAESEPGIHGNYLCFFLSCLTEYQLLVLLRELIFRL